MSRGEGEIRRWSVRRLAKYYCLGVVVGLVHLVKLWLALPGALERIRRNIGGCIC
jgi:hypothetical protein